MIHCYCHRRRSGNTPAIRGEAAAAASDGIPPVPQWDDLMLEDIYEEIVKPNKGSWKGRLINGTNKVKRTGDVMNALLNSLADKGYLTRQQKPTSTSSDPQFISLLLASSKRDQKTQKEEFVAMKQTTGQERSGVKKPLVIIREYLKENCLLV